MPDAVEPRERALLVLDLFPEDPIHILQTILRVRILQAILVSLSADEEKSIATTSMIQLSERHLLTINRERYCISIKTREKDSSLRDLFQNTNPISVCLTQ